MGRCAVVDFNKILYGIMRGGGSRLKFSQPNNV